MLSAIIRARTTCCCSPAIQASAVPGTCNAVSGWVGSWAIIIKRRRDWAPGGSVLNSESLAAIRRSTNRGRPLQHQLTSPVSLPMSATTCRFVHRSIFLTTRHSDKRLGRAGNESADSAGHDDHSAHCCIADCGAFDWETAEITGRRHVVHRHHEAVPSLSRYSVYGSDCFAIPRSAILFSAATIAATAFSGEIGGFDGLQLCVSFWRSPLKIRHCTIFPSFKTGAIAAQ